MNTDLPKCTLVLLDDRGYREIPCYFQIFLSEATEGYSGTLSILTPRVPRDPLALTDFVVDHAVQAKLLRLASD